MLQLQGFVIDSEEKHKWNRVIWHRSLTILYHICCFSTFSDSRGQELRICPLMWQASNSLWGKMLCKWAEKSQIQPWSEHEQNWMPSLTGPNCVRKRMHSNILHSRDLFQILGLITKHSIMCVYMSAKQ